MPKQPRVKTRYPGVYYIEGTSTNGRSEKLYYIHYRKNGKLIEEKAGRQFRDDMTAAKAAKLRTLKIEGDRPTNQERRDIQQDSQDIWTLNRLWEIYKSHKPGLKGRVTDENRYCKHIRPILGDKEPAELTPFDVDRVRLRMLRTHKPGTVKNVLELIRRLANFGVKKHLCPGPSFVIEMPGVNNVKTEDLKPEQLTSLLEAIEQDPNVQAANFMKMVLFTGMRRGELFKLQWQDIDYETGFIHIRDPKGGQDEKIPLNAAAGQLLLDHPRADSPFVFPGRGGRQRVDINKQVNRIKQQAGLPKDFRPLHGLRHVYASMLASSGRVDLYTLQKLLTHKSPAMTQRYAHLRDEALRQASDLAGDIIAGITNGNGRQDKVEEV
jgi:integrase